VKEHVHDHLMPGLLPVLRGAVRARPTPSFEVKPVGGERLDLVAAASKRVLAEAWRRLEVPSTVTA
jgi:hypothetical protein